MENTNSPGKSHREGISLFELQRMFPDEESAREWFEGIIWSDGVRRCPRCGSDNTHDCAHAKMPYRCRDCRKYFSVKTGTVMAGSPLSLLKWVYAIYLDVTSLKGVSSMKLHRDLGITQKTAWHMQQRIREAFAHEGAHLFTGPVESDETAIGGLEKNKHASKRKHEGRGSAGKAIVHGILDRPTNKVKADVVETPDAVTLQGRILDATETTAQVYTDDARAYKGIARRHESVSHSAGEYVREQAHTNGIESFWAMLDRGIMGTFHKVSPKHLQRYVNEFAARHNIRDHNTISQMTEIAAGMSGRYLPYSRLIADNGLDSGSRT